MFKRRSLKGNIRSTEAVKASESDDDEKDVDLSALQSTKLDQTLRKKKSGLDAANVMNKGARSKASDSGDSQVADISIGANMKSQFSSKMLGTAPTISHENIMEQYVEEALGLRKDRANSDVDKGPKTEEERLILEAKTKYSGGGLLETDSEAIEAGVTDNNNNSNNDKKEETDVDTSVFTGIAEVELPSSYKLKAMKETEKSLVALMGRRKEREEERNSHQTYGKGEFRINTIQRNLALTDVSSGYGGRFQKPKSRADYEAEERRRNMLSVSGGSVATVPLPPDLSKATGANDEDTETPASTSTDGRNPSHRQSGFKANRSNDDRMIENYKKRLKYG